MLVLRSRLLVWAPMLVVSGDGGRMQGGFTEAMYCGDGGWVVRRVRQVILGVEMLVGVGGLLVNCRSLARMEEVPKVRCGCQK